MFSEREKALYNQLDDLHQSYLLPRNTKLQKLKSDIEKDSNELDRIDPKNWNATDRQRLSQHWIDLQRKLDDHQVDLIYKARLTTNPSSYLGELHLKTPNQDAEHLQLARLHRTPMPLLDPFENQEAMFRSNQVISQLFSQIDFSTTDSSDDQRSRIQRKNEKTNGRD